MCPVVATLQMLVAVGTDPGTFGLQDLVHFRLLELFWRLIMVHELPWRRPHHTKRVVLGFKPQIQRLMALFRKLFHRISKSGCMYTKLHNILHALETLLKLASLRIGDTGRGEQANRVVKHGFRGTNKKRLSSMKTCFDAWSCCETVELFCDLMVGMSLVVVRPLTHPLIILNSVWCCVRVIRA